MDWPLIILFGFGVGLLVGTTGVGGGSLMTPALILLVGTAPVTAIGTDLAYAAVTKTVGGWRHQAGADYPVSVIFLVPAGIALAATALHFLRARTAERTGARAGSVQAATSETPA